MINIQSGPEVVVPDQRDLYILGWFFEPFDGKWFMDVYHRNPQAQFVILTDMYTNALGQLARVQIFRLCHYTTWFQALRQMNPGPVPTKLHQRHYKLSALSSRLAEFKFFITAKLLDKSDPSALFTWNRGFDFRSIDTFVFDHTNYKYLDVLIDKHKDTLRHSSINAQQWNNSPLENCFFGHDAYTSTIINCVNETQSLSLTPEFGLLPLPYLTEKTWKPLFAGNAVLFSSQAFTKTRLESFGFVFDYPWAQNFDEEVHDMHRYNTVLNHIDWIMSLDKGTLVAMCQHSIEHNIELAWSDRLDAAIRVHNDSIMHALQQHLAIC